MVPRMGQIKFGLPDDDEQRLRAAAEASGDTLSAYIRQRLFPPEPIRADLYEQLMAANEQRLNELTADLQTQDARVTVLEELERRLSRLEEMAGL